MKILDDYFKLQMDLYNYFGYEEDWKVIPINDERRCYWSLLNGEGSGGSVRYAETKEQLINADIDNLDSDYYEDDIYTQRFLPKWVYRGKDYTMICCNPHVDGNFFLRIFDNLKEIKL